MGAVAGVSEVGSAEVTWIGDLITKDLLLRAFERPLLLHSALKCTQLTIQEQAFHAATERMGDVEELRLEYSTNRNLASIVTDSLVANSRLPEGEDVTKLRTWLPTIASSVGMALGGLLGAAVGLVIQSESAVIVCCILGFLGGSPVFAMLGWRWHSRRETQMDLTE